MTIHDPTPDVALSTTVEPGRQSPQQATRSIKLPPSTTPEHRTRQRQTLVPRARLVTFSLLGFLVAVALRLVALAIDISDLTGRGTQDDQAAISAIPLDSNATLALISRVGLAAFGAIAAVAFVLWLRRARENWSTQGRPRFTPIWTVLMWFVPGINLWRPPQLVADLFAERPSMRRIDNSDAWMIATWWIPGVIGFLGQVALRVWAAADDADMVNPITAAGQSTWHYLAFGAYTLMGVSAISAMFIVQALTARHDVTSRHQ